MNNTPLANLELPDIASVVKRFNLPVTADQLAEIIREMTPEKSLQARKTSGSPNPQEQNEMVQALSQGISNYRAGITKRTKMVEASFNGLEQIVHKYLET